MKKMMLALVCSLSLSTLTLGGEGDKKIVIYTESSEDVVFEMTSTLDEKLIVHIEGVDDEFASLSLIDRRGKSFTYEFLKLENQNYYFDLSKLEKGLYYVKLNFDGEIRMKTLIVK